ncbi:hypothetical protein ACFFX0_10370 [Citricoccus parietis]|uniref:Uncharacterized protein n=1 Tax=Citricoccus parietis TaxID=592307 RepID=A0ABV5FY51_9MICC
MVVVDPKLVDQHFKDIFERRSEPVAAHGEVKFLHHGDVFGFCSTATPPGAATSLGHDVCQSIPVSVDLKVQRSEQCRALDSG